MNIISTLFVLLLHKTGDASDVQNQTSLFCSSLGLHYLCKKQTTSTAMETMKRTAELDRLSFTILAIEASAKKLGITPAEMRRRLERAGLIKNLIVDCYDTLHTESREAVANDVVEALENWERRRNG